MVDDAASVRCSCPTSTSHLQSCCGRIFALSRLWSVLGAPPRVHVQWMAAVCREDCSCSAPVPGQTVADWAHSVSWEQPDWGEPPELLFCPRCLTVYLASHT